MDIKIVNQTDITKHAPTETPKTPDVVLASAAPDLEKRAVEQALGLDSDSDKVRFKHEIDLLVQFAKANAKGQTFDDLKWAIRSLELRVGTPPISEHRARFLARYAYLASEQKKIEQELKSFEKHV